MQFRENEALFLQWLARAKDNITITGEANLVSEIEAGYRAYRYGFSQWTDLNVRSASVSALYLKSVYPLFTKVKDACIGLRRLNEDTMYAASVKAGVVANRAIWSTSFVAGAALVVALIFSLFLAERVVRPIRGFMAASRKISAGDYAVQVPVETDDELGSLAREFNEMATKLLRYHEMNIEQIIAEKNKGEAILSSIEDGLVVFDIKLNITSINPVGKGNAGVTLAETVSLQCLDILPDSNICDLIRETVETGSHRSIPEHERLVVLTAGKLTRLPLFGYRHPGQGSQSFGNRALAQGCNPAQRGRTTQKRICHGRIP